MRALGLVVALVVVACASPAPPPKPVTTPPATPVATDGPSWIGVRLDNASPRITQLIRGAPGERAGLQIGDEIVTLDGRAVPSPGEFVQRVMRTPSGTALEVVVIRGGGRITFHVTVAPRPESPAQSSLIDKPAPAFAAAPISGTYAPTLADHLGHVVVVDFWATWCGPCAITIPRLKELHGKLADRGLRIIGLSNEEPSVIQAFVERARITYAIGRDRDDQISQQYLREGIPMFVIIDKRGVVRRVIVGADMDTVEEAVLSLL